MRQKETKKQLLASEIRKSHVSKMFIFSLHGKKESSGKKKNR